MTATTPTPAAGSGGAWTSSDKIYAEVLDMKMEIVKLKTQLGVLGFVVTPILSTVVATVVTTIMGGK